MDSDGLGQDRPFVPDRGTRIKPAPNRTNPDKPELIPIRDGLMLAIKR